MAEIFAFLVIAIFGGGGAAVAVSSLLRSKDRKKLAQRQRALEADGFHIPILEECSCSSRLRNEAETSTGKKICLTCEKRIYE